MPTKGKRIGINSLYIAPLLSDDAGSTATYGAPVKLSEVTKAGYERQTNRVNVEADDMIVDTISGYGEVKITIDMAALTTDEVALILGQTVINGVRSSGANDNPPYWCVMFKAPKSNGKFQYVKLLKVQFNEPKEDFETKKPSISVQNKTLEGVGINRLSDGICIREADEDSSTYVTATGTNWFASGDITVDTTLPTISSTLPANNATGVAVGSTFAWTFSEAILASAVNSANFFVIKDSDGSMVSGTLSQNVAKTVITFTPSANLTAATAYRAICTSDVCDLSANRLANNDVRKFTTA